MVSFRKNGFKYLIGYENNDKAIICNTWKNDWIYKKQKVLFKLNICLFYEV